MIVRFVEMNQTLSIRNLISLMLFLFCGMVLGTVIIKTMQMPIKWTVFSLIAFLSFLVLLLSNNFKYFFLTILTLSLPITIDKVFFITPTYNGGEYGLSISLLDVCLFFLFLHWVYETTLSKTKFESARNPLLVPLIGWIVMSFVSITNSSFPTISLYASLQMVKSFFLFYYIANRINSDNERKLILFLLVGSLFLQSTLGLAQSITGSSFNLDVFGGSKDIFEKQLGEVSVTRAQGTFPNSAPFSEFLDLTIPLALVVLLSTETKFIKTISAFVVVPSLIVLILTLSRGSWAGLIISAFISLLIAWKNKIVPTGRVVKIILLGVVLLLIVFVLFSDILISRFTDYRSMESAASRIPLMKAAIGMIQDFPLTGVGLMNCSAVIQFYDPTRTTFNWATKVHNQFLLVASEIGLIGFLFFLWFLYRLIKMCFEVISERKDIASLIPLGIFTGLIAVHIHFMVIFTTPGKPVFTLILFYAGLIVGYKKTSGELT